MTKDSFPELKGIHPPKTKLGMTKIATLAEAAEQLFASNGFNDVSVSDICKKAHTAVGTFYIYFDSKADVYRYLIEGYKLEIREMLAKSISGCTNRRDAEREGIKCFVRYGVSNPTVYNIVWGSLAVDKQMFQEYYVSFAKSYARALEKASDEVLSEDTTTLAYMLMGITNFVGLHAIFENMDEQQINNAIDKAVMPVLENGMFR